MDIPGLYHLDFAFDVKDLRDGDDNAQNLTETIWL